jgi:Eco57I restriction-modification methylase
MARRTNDFQTIRSEGGLLPPDLLRRVLDPKEKLPGTLSEDYGLPQGERINDVITQSWNRLRKHWAEFRAAAEALSENEPGTGLTNDKWNLPLLRELDFGLLPTSAGPEVGGRTYAINRFFGSVPIHLIGCGLSLDRRAAGVRGAAAVNPHGLVQEFLNRSPSHLWAIVSNGLRFRVLRDNQALSRQSFLEFDLEAIFAGEVYSDFVLLWLLAHATRFAPREGDRPETCWLEQWTKLADEQGTRALGELRGGVERALQILGEGFVSHPKNTALREALRKGKVNLSDFHGQLLRLVYRLIFLFVAEDRTLDGEPLIHPRDSSEAAATARERYATHYSTDRLRELASKIKGSRHGDLWRQFQILVGALSGDQNFAGVREHLALPALGSFLWNPATTPALNNAELTNHDFLEALRHLAFTRQGKILRPVDYKNLGSEEFGGVYESFLALTLQISSDGARFTFAEFAGNERKTSGSYYTHDSLVQCLLDSALDPVVEQAIRGKTGAEAEKAILALKVCDSAVGSGHFLVGGAHRLARHLARVRALAQGESEPSPLLYQTALRDVIGHCLYGVDINPMAVELCKVTLWLEALEPGKPLSFLDHHIRCGNSLLGTTPELIAAGLPDDVFNAIEGDDKKVCSALKKRNKQERESGQQDMLHLMVAEGEAEYNSIETRTRRIEDVADDTIDEVQQKAELFGRLIVSPEYQHAQLVADAWCAAFVWQKQRGAGAETITTDTIRRLTSNSTALTPYQVAEVERLSHTYQFFHWHLAFPEVFAKGGFDCVLGNPPWEQAQVSEKEFFASSAPEIATATGEARKRFIRQLITTDAALYAAFISFKRGSAASNHFIRASNHYPLTATGKINSYALFAETNRAIAGEQGRAGFIVPTGIATDDTTKWFFQDLVSRNHLISLVGFENAEGLFPSVKSSTRFCLITLGKAATPTSIRFSFFLRSVVQVGELATQFTLTADEISYLNPNTKTCPVFRTDRDCTLTKSIYRRVPVLLHEARDTTGNPWQIQFTQGLFNTTSDSGCFRTAKDLEAEGWRLDGNLYWRDDECHLPLFEAKMAGPLDHRAMTFTNNAFRDTAEEDLRNGCYVTLPQYWVEERLVRAELPASWSRSWLAGWQDITDVNTMARSVKAAIVPLQGVADTFLLHYALAVSASSVLSLQALLNTFTLDYVARQKIGGVHLKYPVFKQLAVIAPSVLRACAPWDQGRSSEAWTSRHALELCYTAWDLESFAQDCGWPGPPFRWDEERRFLLRCELDAAFFHLYYPPLPRAAGNPPAGPKAPSTTRPQNNWPNSSAIFQPLATPLPTSWRLFPS